LREFSSFSATPKIRVRLRANVVEYKNADKLASFGVLAARSDFGVRLEGGRANPAGFVGAHGFCKSFI
jgi:hypothetical protein